MITEKQKRVIRENPRVSTNKLAKLIGESPSNVIFYKQKYRVYDWCYSAVGIPFLYFNKSRVCYTVIHKSKILFAGKFSIAIKVVDHLIWCIENDIFNQPRIENPYLTNLKFGE